MHDQIDISLMKILHDFRQNFLTFPDFAGPWQPCQCHHRNDLQTSKTANALTEESLQSSEYSVNELIKNLEDNEYKIDEVYYKHNITNANLIDVPSRESEAKWTFEFIKSTQQEIATLYIHLHGVPAVSLYAAGAAASLDDILAVVSNKAVSKVNLDCKVFNSDKATKFEFRD